MNITSEQLRRIIKEELEQVLNSEDPHDLPGIEGIQQDIDTYNYIASMLAKGKDPTLKEKTGMLKVPKYKTGEGKEQGWPQVQRWLNKSPEAINGKPFTPSQIKNLRNRLAGYTGQVGGGSYEYIRNSETKVIPGTGGARYDHWEINPEALKQFQAQRDVGMQAASVDLGPAKKGSWLSRLLGLKHS